MATKVLGSAFGDFKAYYEYELSSTSTTYTIKVINAGMYQSCTYATYPWKTTMTATSYDSRYGTDATATTGKGYHSILEADKSYTYTKKTSSYTVTIKATTKKNISGGSSGSVSKTFTIPALTKYTITYNANGGSGTPSATYKYYGISAALSSTKPTRTGYTFLGWSTSSTATSATWAAGGSYTTNASDTLYAVWKANTYTVTFNANGGTNGSVTSKTKTYDTAMTLPTAAQSPTRQYYNFLGWSTSASATSATWTAGATYSTNITSNTTLYAVWEEAYVPATISNPTAKRVSFDEGGNIIDDDEGTYGNVTFTWSHGTLEGNNETPTSIIVYIRETDSTDTTWYEAYSVTDFTATSVNTGAFQYNGAELSTESQYDIKVILTDNYNGDNPATASTFISKAKFTMDINAAGDSVSIGEAASDDESELFNVKWDARFKGNVSFDSVAGVRQNINFIGVNPIASTDDDTPANWATLGTGVALINSSGVITNKPTSAGGFVVNEVYGGLVFQTWHGMNGLSTVWHRSGNASGWYSDSANWVKSYDEYSTIPIENGGTGASTKEQALINLLGYTPSYIQVRATALADSYSTSKNYFMPFYSGTAPTVYSSTKGNLTLTTDSVTFGDREGQTVYGVRVGANINMVRVNAMVYFTNNTTTRTTAMATIYRWRDDTQTAYTLAATSLKSGEGAYGSCCPTAIMYVEEGDFIFVGAYKGTASCDISVGSTNGRTTMIVEAIG